MLCIEIRFPLGVYYAIEPDHKAAEWAPHPVRLIGALLAAAHEIPSDDLQADRAVLQRVCEAAPPTIHAPIALPPEEQLHGDPPTAVAALRGASRWAPRNPGSSEWKHASPTMIGHSQAEVFKNGVAIGDRRVEMVWPNLTLDDDSLARLGGMAANVAWLGTSRSPAILRVDDSPTERGSDDPTQHVWSPLPFASTQFEVQLRVPNATLLETFDAAFDRRKAPKADVTRSGHLAPAQGGEPRPYSIGGERVTDADLPIDPAHWGRFTVLELERDYGIRPQAAATYLVARALRAALMSAFPDRGQQGDAPPVLHGHDGAPHLAVVPLPSVGHRHARGTIHGIALVYPSSDRLPDVAHQQQIVEAALQTFLPDANEGRAIAVPGLGEIRIGPVHVGSRQLWALNRGRYVGPSKCWTTVTPVVHSRWQKRGGRAALSDQVVADCRHVGLPAPAEIEVLRTSGVEGGPARLLPPAQLPATWRRSLAGPMSHLRLTFDRPVSGPLLIGRARHFGVGLCVPAPERTQ